MNKIFIALMILASCSKDTSEKPVESEAISFTQTREMYSDQQKYEGTLLVVHFHRVESPALIAQYKAIPPMKIMCDEQVNNDTMYTKIGKPCLDDCGLK